MILQTLPGLFISHGSPMLALQPAQVGPALARLSLNLPTPHAIVIMSAHWESLDLEVSIATRPETWHDFRGFPAELYQLRYPAPGSPQLAEEILALFAQAGLTAYANNTRPRDHGVWMPLLHLYPDADIPVIHISLPVEYSPHQLLDIGRVLSTLRERQILLIGSGSITHNLAMLDRQSQSPVPHWAAEFRQYIAHHLQHQNYEAVLDWQNIPYARQNHPTIEHLAPLFFAMGTGKRFSLVHSSFMMGSLGMDIYRFD